MLADVFVFDFVHKDLQLQSSPTGIKPHLGMDITAVFTGLDQT